MRRCIERSGTHEREEIWRLKNLKNFGAKNFGITITYNYGDSVQLR